MEEQNIRYLQDFLCHSKLNLEICIIITKDHEARLRGCYDETIEFCSDEFVRIILVDAAFIIEVLLRWSFRELLDENDWTFYRPVTMAVTNLLDMQMLENQLPFFILNPDKDKLPMCDESLSILDLSVKFFQDPMFREETDDLFEVEHFVGLVRALSRPNFELSAELKTITIPSMTELHQAGVTFMVGSSKNLFDIRFTNGILEIPKLKISPAIEFVIRNILAFEQCHMHCDENYINDYVVIMDRFVNTPKDVELLVEHGIVENLLGDSTGAEQVVQNALSQMKANLRQNYFNTPWATISVVAAVVLHLLSACRTFIPRGK
ncbi:unnamed protein product [Prunus armeniaca]